MRRYETIVIADPDLPEDDRSSLLNRIKEIIPQFKGTLIEEDLWGTRKLAYQIKKKPRGYYARYDYCGTGALVDELERFFRIDDRVLKYMTVQLDPDADAEQILAEIAAVQAPAEAEPAAPEKPDAEEAASEEKKQASTETEVAHTATETIEEE